MITKDDLTEIIKHKEAASDMISALCQPRGSRGHRDWIMSIPALPDYDPDLVIGQALRDESKLIDEIKRLQACLEDAKRALKQYAAIPDIGGPAERLLNKLDRE